MFFRGILTAVIYAIFIPLIGGCIPGRTVSRESNIHSGTFHNAEQFSVVVPSVCSFVCSFVCPSDNIYPGCLVSATPLTVLYRSF